MDNNIIDFLNLNQEDIENLQCSSLKDEFIVEYSLKRKPHQCPHCGMRTDKVLNTYTRKFTHDLFSQRVCIVHYQQKRYKCSYCNKTFNEENPLVSKGQKKSLATLLTVMELLKNPHVTFKMVSEQVNLSITSVINTFISNVPTHKVILPRILCIDEIYLGRKAVMKYCAILLDFETNRIVDVIYGRSKNALHSYFNRIPSEHRRNVQYISSDMYEGFRAMKNTYFPWAKQCVDAFHVIKLINDMFENQLKRIMRLEPRDTDAYYLLKKKRQLLISNAVKVDWSYRQFDRHFKYTISNEKLKEFLFSINPIIKDLYELKEEYLFLNSRKELPLIENLLDSFTQECLHHSHTEVKRIGRTLLKWRKEILHSFTRINNRRISNGPIESRNNIIQLLIRNAAGYRNFDHLRLRVIYVINHKKE